MNDSLITSPNLSAPDEFYEALIEAHQDLDTAASHALNARLVLLLANHVGTLAVLKQALAAARASGARVSTSGAPNSSSGAPASTS